jgi:aspartyl/asparaginyl-tRNA synthetase
MLFTHTNTILEGEDNVGTIPERMVRSVEHYPTETIVVVHGKLRKAPQRVKNATIHDYELDVYEVHKVSNLTENVPFTVYDAENINRDKEDVAEDNVDDAEEETPVLSPSDGTPRASQELSRLSQELMSRSE